MTITLTISLPRRARTIAAVALLWVASSAGAAGILAGLGALADHNAAAPVIRLTPGLAALPGLPLAGQESAARMLPADDRLPHCYC